MSIIKGFFIVLIALLLSSCTIAEQEMFFIKFGPESAKTQSLDEAKRDWSPEIATPEQKKILEHIQEQQAAYFAGIVAAANARSNDCFEAVDRHFSGPKDWFKGIVWRESRNIPSAANPSSTARGCAQLLMSLHSHRYYAVGCTPNDWADPDCNIKAADHLYRQAGSSPWRL